MRIRNPGKVRDNLWYLGHVESGVYYLEDGERFQVPLYCDRDSRSLSGTRYHRESYGLEPSQSIACQFSGAS